MKRKFLLVFLTVITTICCTIGLVACGGGDKDNIVGTYYYYANNTYTSQYIKLNSDDTIEISNGRQRYDGIYNVSGTQITLTVYGDDSLAGMESGISEDMTVFGTISNGVLAITINGETGYFCKKGSTPSSSVPGEQSGKLYFKLNHDDESYIVRRYTGNQTTVIIPSTYENLPVTDIGENAFNGCTFESITIPDSVTSIGENAFYNCNSLKSITIPDRVTSIGDQAFYGCDNLISVTIGKSVTSIGDRAFEDCNSLESIEVEVGNAVYRSSGNCLIETATKTLILGCKNSIIPTDGSVTSIGEKAFYNCNSLESITIPDSVVSIGDSAFSDCSRLMSVTVGKSVTSIGDRAFEYCNRLYEVYNLSSLTIEKGSTGYGYVGYHALDVYTSLEESKLTTTEDGYIFYKNETDYSLLLYTGKETELTLPDSFNGSSYRIYNSAFSGCDRLTSVTIPGGVTSIGAAAFRGCDRLTSIIIPDSVTFIGDSAFYGCSALTGIVIPDSVTSIGDSTFYYCDNLANITLPDSVISIHCGAFINTAYYINEDNWQDGVLYIGKHLIDANRDLPNEYTIKQGTLTIADFAFSGPRSLTSIIIPDSVTSIGDEAFAWCNSLTNVNIPDSVISIGNRLFWQCDNLTSITVAEGNPVYQSKGNCLIETETKTLIAGCGNSIIPDDGSVTSIGESAFSCFASLTSIIIPEGVTSIGDNAFSLCDNLTSVTLPVSLTSIGTEAFRICSNLTSIVIPDNVTSIGDRAFEDCKKLFEVYNLSSLTIEKGSTDNGYVGRYALAVYTSLEEERKLTTTKDGYIFYQNETDCFLMGYTGDATELTLPDSFNGSSYRIYNSAFSNCSRLTSIIIPDSVISIGSKAFYYCSNLISISIGKGVTFIGDSEFDGCNNLASITLPDSVISISKWAFNNTEYYNNRDNWQDGVLYIGKHLIEATYDMLGEYEIKQGTLTIADSAFDNCMMLTRIIIPASVISIGDSAFFGCSGLTSIIIPDSVTSIGNYAFCNCLSLTSITIPDSVTSIGKEAFRDCTSLTSITIPDSVTSIGKEAFSHCTSLTNIVIPDNVTSIGDSAFYDTAYYNNEDNWQDGVLYIGKHLIDANRYLPNEYTIKQGTLTIADHAFSGRRSLTSITIPDSVTSIGEEAFSHCTSLTSIIIPDSVTSIGECAFYGCSKLNIVYYQGTAEEWNKISIGIDNSKLTSATRYYYSESEPTEDGNYWHYVDGVPTIWVKETT